MFPRFVLYACLAWLAILLLAVLNGAARDALLVPLWGETAARAASSLILAALIVLVAWVFLARTRPLYRRGHLPAVGMLWLVLTLAFEFGFFHLVMGRPLAELLADYNLAAGRLWLLVLATACFAPVLVGRRLKPPRLEPRADELREP